jgi:trimethylamine:corrinoid methyltransferase-like protein
MRRRSAARKTATGPDFRHLSHPFAPQTDLTEDHVAAMHVMARRLPEETGMAILLPEAVGLPASAGAGAADAAGRVARMDAVIAAMEAPGCAQLLDWAGDVSIPPQKA